MKQDVASTNRPGEYIGTIAIDHVTAGKSIENIIEPLIYNYKKEGYHPVGFSIDILDPHDFFLNDDELSIKIELSKKGLRNSPTEHISVKEEISAKDFLLACTAISIRLSM